MRSLIKKLKNQKRYDFSFEDLDEAKIKKDLNLTIKAKENGRLDLPRSSSTGRDEVENEIVSFFEALIETNEKRLSDRIKTWHNKVNQLKLSLDFTGLESIPRNIKATYAGIKNTEMIELESAYKQLKNRENDLSKYRTANNLNRSADYPDSKIAWVFWVLFIFVLEVLLNANFFSQGHELGLMGGIIEATTISLINIGFGLVIGKFILPFKNCVKVSAKLISSFLTLFSIMFLLGFNLFSAHYREVFITNPMEVDSSLAIKSFQSQPLGLTDFHSWVLVFLGWLVIFFSVYKGYTFDDPYPGFGKVSRMFDDAENDYYAFKKNIEKKVEDIKEKAIHDIEVLQQKIHTKSELFTDAMLSNNHSIDAYIAFTNRVNFICNNLITYYQSANQELRNTPAPNHFGTEIDISSSTEVFNGKRISVNDDMNSKYENLNTLIDTIEEETLKQYISISDKIRSVCDDQKI